MTPWATFSWCMRAPARDAPAAVSAANIMLELVILLSPSSAPSFCAQEDTCADAERATEDLLKYLAFHAVPPAEEKEADTAKRTAMRQQLLEVLLLLLLPLLQLLKELCN